MQPYANTGGESNVVAYSVSDASIIVQFRSGKQWFYEYTDASAGADMVSEMIRLAQAGSGLNSYIGTRKPAYSRKW